VLLVAAGGTYFGTKTFRPSNSHNAGQGNTGIAGAAGGSGTSSTLPPIGNGYISTGADYVDFIQWNNNDGTLSGSAQAVVVQGTPPDAKTSSDTLSVSGTLNGSAISVSFEGSPPEFGTISGGSFTLDFPQPDGTLAPITFNSVSAEQYNSAVADLGQRVSQANQTAANAEALQKEEQKIDADAAQAQSDISEGLSGDESSLTQDVKGIPPLLQEAASDLAKAKAEEQTVAGEPGAAQQCDNSYTTSDDAYTVSDDAYSVADQASTVQDDLNAIRQTVQSLQSDFATLQSDESSLPGYNPSGAPSKSDVSNAIAGANGAVASAIPTTNGYIDQVNADVTTAYQYAGQATQAGNCGTAPTAPTAAQHVS